MRDEREPTLDGARPPSLLPLSLTLPPSLSLSLCRAVSIDFNRMRVSGKSLRVRRLDDGRTVWLWYCTLGRRWIKYGDEVDGGPRVLTVLLMW